MHESARATVKCQDAGDGTGEVIVELPDDIIKSMGLKIGDSLNIELADGAIVLTPVGGASNIDH
ncbi:AbrB/MazE/SpoVT family DNA-binding domain-containing protein [Pseudomonas sp. NPDC089547]|uniref:AbrB/MazE/SpoVT family DNA-binding domain-containing protein n=1 Tax=Pseudomonas sp. NPDC089547 TaxID=3390652 RepID=UPI003D02BC83